MPAWRGWRMTEIGLARAWQGRLGRPRSGASLRGRVGMLIATVVTVVVLAGGFLSWNAWRSASLAHHQRVTLLPSAADTGLLLAALLDQETGERGYLLTDNRLFLQPYIAGHAQAVVLLARLQALLAASPTLQGMVTQVDHSYTTWLKDTAEPAIARERAGRSSKAASIAILERGRKEFNGIRADVATLSTALSDRLESANSEIAAQDRTTLFLVIGFTVVGASLALASRVALSRWVVDPIDRLVGEVRQVAGGDLDRPVSIGGSEHSVDELVALSGDVEAMRRRLRDELEDARQAREALEAHDPISVRIREQLSPTLSGIPAGPEAPLSFGARSMPSRGLLSGDWYDVLHLGPGRVGAVIADISGHGPDAGLFALQLRYLLVPALRSGRSPGDAISWVAEQLGETDERYATAAVVEVDLERGRCRWANAAHPPVLRFRDGAVATLGSTGSLVGPLPGTWETRETSFEPGDVLVLYTDGIVEAKGAQGAFFGSEALTERVAACGAEGADRVVEAVISAVRKFAGGALSDDATVIALAAAASGAQERR